MNHINTHISGLILMVSVLTPEILDLVFRGEKEIKPANISKKFVLLPSILIAILQILGWSLIDFLKWICLHTQKFIVVQFILAISTIIGGAFDSLYALQRYQKENGSCYLSRKQKLNIIQFGDPEFVVPQKGVYDLSFNHLLYTSVSNITAMFIPLSIILFIRQLPNFYLFLDQTSWIDVFTILGPPSVGICFLQYCGQHQNSRPENIKTDVENPDNYYFNRLHVLLMMVHLWFTSTMIMILIFILTVYVWNNVHQFQLNFYFLLPLAATLLFFIWCSDGDPKYKGTNSTALFVGLLLLLVLETILIILSNITLYTILTAITSAPFYLEWGHLAWITRKKEIKNLELAYSTKWIISFPFLAAFLILSAIILQLIS